MPLGRICPGSKAICADARCRRRCRHRVTPQRQLNHTVYGRRAHRAQRLRVLARDDYTCVDCGHRDDSGRSLVADHRDGIDQVRAFADDELETRCRRCSGSKDGKRQRRG